MILSPLARNIIAFSVAFSLVLTLWSPLALHSLDLASAKTTTPQGKRTKKPPAHQDEAYKLTVRTQLEKAYDAARQIVKTKHGIDMSKFPSLNSFLTEVAKDPNFLKNNPRYQDIYISLNHQAFEATSQHYGISPTTNKEGKYGRIERLDFYRNHEFLDVSKAIIPSTKPKQQPQKPLWQRALDAPKQVLDFFNPTKRNQLSPMPRRGTPEYKKYLQAYADKVFQEQMKPLREKGWRAVPVDPRDSTKGTRQTNPYITIFNIDGLFHAMYERYKQIAAEKNPEIQKNMKNFLQLNPELISILRTVDEYLYEFSEKEYGKRKNSDEIGKKGTFANLFQNEYKPSANNACSATSLVYGALGVPNVYMINRSVNGWGPAKSAINALMFWPTDSAQNCINAFSINGNYITLSIIPEHGFVTIYQKVYESIHNKKISPDQVPSYMMGKNFRKDLEGIVNSTVGAVVSRNVLNNVVSLFEHLIITPIVLGAVKKLTGISFHQHIVTWREFGRGSAVAAVISITMKTLEVQRCKGSDFSKVLGECRGDSFRPRTVEDWAKKHIPPAFALGAGVTAWPVSDVLLKYVDRFNGIQKANNMRTVAGNVVSGAKALNSPVARGTVQPLDPKAIKMLKQSGMSANEVNYYANMYKEMRVSSVERHLADVLEQTKMNWKSFRKGVLMAFLLPAIQWLITNAIFDLPQGDPIVPLIKTNFEAWQKVLTDTSRGVAETFATDFLFLFSIDLANKVRQAMKRSKEVADTVADAAKAVSESGADLTKKEGGTIFGTIKGSYLNSLKRLFSKKNLLFIAGIAVVFHFVEMYLNITAIHQFASIPPTGKATINYNNTGEYEIRKTSGYKRQAERLYNVLMVADKNIFFQLYNAYFNSMYSRAIPQLKLQLHTDFQLAN